MHVTRTSQWSGKTRTLELDMTPEQEAEYNKGEKNIQDVFPNLTKGQREFLMSGVTEEEWNEAFPPD